MLSICRKGRQQRGIKIEAYSGETVKHLEAQRQRKEKCTEQNEE